jgi:hypothetical protein
MTVKTVLFGVTLASVFWGAATEAVGRVVQVRAKCSGTAMSIHWDTNHDGFKAGLGTVSCISKLGRSTAQGVGEGFISGPATCPNGKKGIGIGLLPGTGHTVARYEKTGDMIFSELTSETVCYDPSTGTQFKSGTDKITGGTGRFVGASGETQFQATAWPLYVDSDGNGFAAQEETITGTLILPDK